MISPNEMTTAELLGPPEHSGASVLQTAALRIPAPHS